MFRGKTPDFNELKKEGKIEGYRQQEEYREERD